MHSSRLLKVAQGVGGGGKGARSGVVPVLALPASSGVCTTSAP